MEYTPYELLYAMQVFEGKRTLESIPKSLRANVERRVNELQEEKYNLELGGNA